MQCANAVVIIMTAKHTNEEFTGYYVDETIVQLSMTYGF